MDNTELLKEFIDEALTHIAAVEVDLLNLENGAINAGTINNLFRAVHSIKGTAGFFSLQNIVQLSHVMESVFSKLQNGMAISNEIIDILLSANDYLKRMITDVENSDKLDISNLVGQLSQFGELEKTEILLEHPGQEESIDTDIVEVVTKSQNKTQVNKALTFFLAGNHYCLDIVAVKEINRKIDYTPIPDAPSHIVGLFNMRGQVVTLINLAKLIGWKDETVEPCSSCIILKCTPGDQDFIGFLIDRPGSVIEIDEEMSEYPPANINEQEKIFVNRVIKLENELLKLIDHQVILEFQ